MNKYYIYCHIRNTDLKPFYIGKGEGRRAHRKSGRNNYWNKIVKKHGYSVVILVSNISEQMAFELEKKFIQQIGINNLCNMTDGGEGSSGRRCNTETKRKLSEASKKMSLAQRKLIGEVNKRRLKPTYQYSKAGELIKNWNSVKLAADTLNIPASNISMCCTGKLKSAGGYLWKYAEK